MQPYLLPIAVGLLVLVAVLLIVLLAQNKKKGQVNTADIDKLRADLNDQQIRLRQEISETTQTTLRSLGEMLAANQQNAANQQSQKIDEMGKTVVNRLGDIRDGISHQLNQMNANTEDRLKSFSDTNRKDLENIRQTVEKKLEYLQTDNNRKLDEMRKIVDEKLEERMTKSFQLVSERLEQVYKGLGEMQTLASGVGDLKKVLAGVKTRGILGEIQLGAILEEILAPDQYDTNVVTKKGTKNPVEYAIKLPTENEDRIYLPIDSKFPVDAYADLVDAYDSGSKEQIDSAAAMLRTRIRGFAKDISGKYIDPPNTTEFALMFLPFEGLYAEVVNRGLVEELQRDYKVNVAGPSTMAALLNSLQMGFRTFAIQKRSGEVWNVLGAVKTEFDKFGTVLETTQQRLEQANKELDSLIGVRTRQIQKKLKDVASLSQQQAAQVFSLTDELELTVPLSSEEL